MNTNYRKKENRFNDAYKKILSLPCDLNGMMPIASYEEWVENDCGPGNEVQDAFEDLNAADPEGKALEKLKELYAHVTAPSWKSVLAGYIFHKAKFDVEKWLLIVLDDMHFQHKIGDGEIRKILAKYSYFDDKLILNQEECETIAMALLAYLKIPHPDVQNWNDYVKTNPLGRIRLRAAYLLKGLLQYPKTSDVIKKTIKDHASLIVFFSQDENNREFFTPFPLGMYLK